MGERRSEKEESGERQSGIDRGTARHDDRLRDRLRMLAARSRLAKMIWVCYSTGCKHYFRSMHSTLRNLPDMCCSFKCELLFCQQHTFLFQISTSRPKAWLQRYSGIMYRTVHAVITRSEMCSNSFASSAA